MGYNKNKNKMVRLASRTISYINLLEGGCEALPHAYEKDLFLSYEVSIGGEYDIVMHKL